MTPFQLLKASLLQSVAQHPDPAHATFTLSDIEQAMQGLPIEAIRAVGSDTPMGRVQRNILGHLCNKNPAGWNPDEDRIAKGASKSMMVPYINAANGLVARGFALIKEGTYYVTQAGMEEATRKKIV